MTNQLPIMVINSHEIVGEFAPVKVYVHTSNKMDKKIYKEIGITGEEALIYEPHEDQPEKIKQYYLKELMKKNGPNVVLLHSPKMPPDLLTQILEGYLQQKYSIPATASKIYLARSLPKGALKL